MSVAYCKETFMLAAGMDIMVQ